MPQSNKKKYRKIIEKCKVDLIFKDNTKSSVIMNLDINQSVDDQICQKFGEENLKKWFWQEVNAAKILLA